MAAGEDLRAAVESVVSSAPDLDVDQCLGTSVDGLMACSRSLTERLDAYRAQESELQRELTLGRGSPVSIAIALQSVRKLLEQLLNESIVDALAGGNWLPGYAFPQDVVRLVVRDAKVSGRMRLERDVEYGISEYSPGAEVVADGKLLRSGGVDLQNREMEIQYYRSCARCHQVQVTLREEELPRRCTYCEAPATGSGARPSPFIVPRGFTTLVEEPATDVRVHRVLPPRASEVFLLSGAPKEAFATHPLAPGFELGHAPNGELFRANPGRDLKGFKLCRACGRAVSKAGPHRKPWGTQCAGGHLLQLHLACRFATDTLQIRFKAVQPAPPGVDDQDFWLSWQMAFLVAAAEVLEIPQRDLGGTYRSEREGATNGELVVFDRVPGGAGYVAAIDRGLPAILRAALMRARECRNPSCDSRGSCYSCLRSYENQFLWSHLQRHRVADWLSQVPVASSHD
jgi:hypothetical protein